MVSKAFENEFLKSLSLLSKEQQNKVLAYVKSLLNRTRKTSQQDLLQFAGTIDAKDIQEISTAIEAGCENIDPDSYRDEW